MMAKSLDGADVVMWLIVIGGVVLIVLELAGVI
jgi:hypothetical protein